MYFWTFKTWQNSTIYCSYLSYICNVLNMSKTNVNLYGWASICMCYIYGGGTVVKDPLANAGDGGFGSSIPGLGRSPREGNGKPLQYPCLENPMDRGAWQVAVHEVARSRTRLSDWAYIYVYTYKHRYKYQRVSSKLLLSLCWTMFVHK